MTFEILKKIERYIELLKISKFVIFLNVSVFQNVGSRLLSFNLFPIKNYLLRESLI